jgi:two-component system, sensor histidine kinase and response regulator
MNNEPSYEELLVIRQELEDRIAELEKAVTRYSEMPDVLHDIGLFGELFKKAADMIIVHEMIQGAETGRIVHANPAALIQLEFSIDELRGMTLNDLMAPGDISDQKQDHIYPETVKYERVLISKSKKRIHSEIHSHVFIHGNDRYAFDIIRNISNRHQMQEVIRQSEKKYKRLVESLHTEYIFYSHDIKGMITYISPSIKKVLGYTPDESMRKYTEFLTDHEMNKQALKHSEESHKGRAQPPFINELYHRDGSTRIFYNTELPLLDDKGKVTGVEGIAHDITDSYRAQEKLRIQEERFRLLVETIEEVFWIHDLKNNKLLYISPKYETLYGRSLESLSRSPGSFLKVVHPDDRDKVKNSYKKINKGIGLDLEYRIISEQGEIKFLWSRSVVITDKKNKPSLSIGTALDITERKNAQQEKDLLAAIIENLEDQAVIKDSDLRIIASNPANTRAAGKKSPDELIGKTDMEIYGDFEHVRQYMEDDQKALELKKGETLASDQVFIYPDGKQIRSQVKKFPVFDKNEKLIAVAAISREIKERKTEEKNMQQSETELREANAAKDKFFSIIAHDLRNPFNSILGFSDLLLKHYESYDQEEVLTFITMINEASWQAHNLLENLLNWSRSQTGRIQFDPTGIDVASIIESAFKLYEGNSSEKNLDMVCKVKKGCLVYGDLNMVATIIRNLISNAIKFTRPRGKITVYSRNRAGMVDILVEDSGVGIPKDMLEKLFRIDENVTRSGTANEEGTGLGLVLCQEFAEKNKGSIKLSSKEGKGTIITLTLPKPEKPG